jgi:hypothetical protein
MRRFLLSAGILLSATSLGCSLFHSKEGFLDRAAAKDTRDGLMIRRCTEDAYNQYCKPDTSAPECREHCG